MKTTERSEAQRLFFQTNYTKTQIAEMLGVSRRTLSLWSHHGNWDKLRKSSRTLPAIVAEKCYHLVDEYTSGLLADKYAAQNINYRHAQTIHLLATSIKKLKNGSTVNEAMQTFNLFLGGLEHRHPELAAQVAPEVDEFIRLTAGTKSTDHLTSSFADDGTIPFDEKELTEQYKNDRENDELNQAFEEFMQHRAATEPANSRETTHPVSPHSSGRTVSPHSTLPLGGPHCDDPDDYSQPDNVYPPGPAPDCTPSHTMVPHEDESRNLGSKATIDPTIQPLIQEDNLTQNQFNMLHQTVTTPATTETKNSAPVAPPSEARTVSPHSALSSPHSALTLFPLPDDIIIIRNALAHSDLSLERKQEIMSRAMAKEGDNYIYREKGRRIAAALEENGFAPYLGTKPMPTAELARFTEVCRNVSVQFEDDVRLYKSWLAASGLKYPPMILNADELTDLDPYHKSDGPLADWDDLFPDDDVNEDYTVEEPAEEYARTTSHL